MSLLNMQLLSHFLDCANLLSLLYIALQKIGRDIFSYLSYIFIVLVKKGILLTFRSNIHIFIYFDDNNKIKNRIIIYLVKNKFLTGLFK